ncbi:MAG: GNAT family N-acetyltransferase [Clostridiales bacterium]|nr:GNAT family N-acetyltransferase [Clostridiales bacterium]
MKFKIIPPDKINDNILNECYYVEINSGGEPYKKEDLRSVLSWPSSVTIVAYDDEKAVGMITANGESSKLGGSIYIVNASVVQEYHRRGIATNIFYELFKFYKRKGINKNVSISVDKDNLPAINMYKKIGFKLVGDYEDEQQFGMFLSLDEFGKNCEIILKEREDFK